VSSHSSRSTGSPLSRRTLVGITTLAIFLLLAVAVASRARPFSASGPFVPQTGGAGVALDVLVSLIIVAGLGVAGVLAYAFWPGLRRFRDDEPFYLVAEPPKLSWTTALLLAAIPVVLVGGLIAAATVLHESGGAAPGGGAGTATAPGTPPVPLPSPGHEPSLVWIPVAAGGALVLLLVGVLAARLVGRRLPAKPAAMRLARQLASALDETIEDLEAEPDARRAVIAAYARMETVLAAGGLARQASETPLEYVSRALTQLETSAGAARRLTDLFERAKFSRHAVDRSMKDDALAALVAVRDDLRAGA
jgi:hypothetical protein